MTEIEALFAAFVAMAVELRASRERARRLVDKFDALDEQGFALTSKDIEPFR